jgi:hypothetical protein
VSPSASTQFAPWALVVSVALAAAACGTSSETSTGPSPVKCQVALTAPQSPIGAAGGAGALSVTTPSECAWTASAAVSWITGLTPASGQGEGQVQFQVAPNPSPTSRQGDITLNGVTARVSQMGANCAFTLTPASQNIAAGASSGTVAVGAPAGCAWTAAATDTWITIAAGSSGSGDGTVSFAVGANSGAARVGGIAIGGQTFVVNQASPTAPGCTYTIQPASASIAAAGGTANVTIQAGAACSWSAASNASWLSVSGTAVGAGNGSVTISAAANPGGARTGTMTIAGQTFTVTQAGQPGACSPSINPTSQSIGAAGGAGAPVSVTASPSCNWTAASNAPWLTVTSGASGTGNGQVDFTVTANSGPARTGTMAVAGQTHTVTQASGCTYSLSAASQTLSRHAQKGKDIDVSAAGPCTWTAVSNASWITITSGASDSGNGTVKWTVSQNTGSNPRTGTITIAGLTFTVTQND